MPGGHFYDHFTTSFNLESTTGIGTMVSFLDNRSLAIVVILNLKSEVSRNLENYLQLVDVE